MYLLAHVNCFALFERGFELCVGALEEGVFFGGFDEFQEEFWNEFSERSLDFLDYREDAGGKFFSCRWDVFDFDILSTGSLGWLPHRWCYSVDDGGRVVILCFFSGSRVCVSDWACLWFQWGQEVDGAVSWSYLACE